MGCAHKPSPDPHSPRPADEPRSVAHAGLLVDATWLAAAGGRRANFSLAASLLHDAVEDSLAHGFSEAVSHDAHYNPAGGCDMKPCPNASQTYRGVHGYLASVASIYGAVWATRRGAAQARRCPFRCPLTPAGGLALTAKRRATPGCSKEG